ncbi:hypothetical protein BT69DRAFT_1035394 [Atractiella rhizophila]|nr:hypothetical protein BT69DRAFT_1035394 [Atractiella rhizophila]
MELICGSCCIENCSLLSRCYYYKKLKGNRQSIRDQHSTKRNKEIEIVIMLQSYQVGPCRKSIQTSPTLIRVLLLLVFVLPLFQWIE